MQGEGSTQTFTFTLSQKANKDSELTVSGTGVAFLLLREKGGFPGSGCSWRSVAGTGSISSLVASTHKCGRAFQMQL